MGMYRRINILLLVVLLSLSNNASRDIVIPYTEDKLDLVSHSIIKIESDEDFINYGFPGNGAFDAPYLIENYNITVQNTSAIIISNTTQYFIVQNCYLKTPYTCISLFNLTEGTATIKNNICEYYYIRSEYQEFSVGIDIVEANQTTVNNNECKGMNYGIRLYESQDTIVNSNICDSTYFSALYTGSPIYDEIDGYGIYVEKSNDCIITQNICRNCSEVGILNRNSNRTIIEKNECYENGDDYCEICIKHENRGGILIEHSYQVIINQNQIERNIDNGIIIQDSENCEILNNTCYDDLW
ncbi:MAG: right-handed parallel beta-helix repeat-containing protein, partial [Candidatus Heimdallarchaeota archaeon]|nr:right-handed parallel beta-helix repeat-containing protein [Candidatus Heimdallarchaeota archaeon]MCK4877356.1 right-handed parallel beta-helix repeat-containing protein [Candidatus Heimdallarchaeota archaeon]